MTARSMPPLPRSTPPSRLPKLFAVAVLLAAPAARAHSWYPHYCCNDQDCAKVDRIEYVVGGMYMIVGETRVFVPDAMEKRPSQDNDAHVCILRTQSGRYRVRCVFMPGTS
jgi:hypothetical protein